MSKDIANLIAHKLEQDQHQHLQCTYSDTRKVYKKQYWYRCATCWPTRNNGCCQACAAVCHKGHDLKEFKYSLFFCDCGAGDIEVDRDCCKIYKKKQYPGDKLPKVRLGGYGIYYLKEEHQYNRDKFEKVLEEHWVNHYIVNENSRYNETEVYVEWIDKRSQPVFDEVRKLCSSWARSCESEPPKEGEVYVWSNQDKKYLLCGTVEEYKLQ